MKKLNFIKASISLCLLVSNIVPLSAQERTLTDSLNINVHAKSGQCNSHELKLSELLIPTALLGISSLYISTPCLVSQKEQIQKEIVGNGKRKTYVDDYLQYTPMIAVYGLNICGVNGKHNFTDRTILLAMSYATMGIAVNLMKPIFKENRPDSNAHNSFPSGHTATAFMGAEFLYKEYQETKPWIGYIGYAIAATTGCLRVYNNRHYFNDVIAGACVGILSTKFAYWLYPKCFKKSKCNQNLLISSMPFYSTNEIGMSVHIQF